MSSHTLRSLVVQLLFSLLTLAFGVLAVGVARCRARTPRNGAWLLTGVTFSISGTVATVAAVLAFPAVVAGPGSYLWDQFVYYSQVANHARAVAVLALAPALMLLVLRPRPVQARATAILLASALAVGAVVGLMFGTAPHETQLALLGAVSLVTAFILFIVLYLALVKSSTDWMLWIALALYAVREMMNSNVQFLISMAGVTWSPPGTLVLWFGAASVAVMLACTGYRFHLARIGRDAPSLMERVRG